MLSFWSMSITAKVIDDYGDVNHWARNYIEYNVSQDLMVGTSNNTFSPDQYVTRAMMVTVLGRHSKIDSSLYNNDISFSDIELNAYYSPYLLWAVENNIVVGFNRLFRPDDRITREDMATMICRYLNCETSGDSSRFIDNDDISDYAVNSVATLHNAGVVAGYPNGSFRPKNYLTRAELCVIMAHLDHQIFDNFEPVKKPEMELLGTYKMTCYCSGCNSPRGSRQTASGKLATNGEYGTVAVSSSLYRNLGAETVLYIEGIGYKTIHDKHGNSRNVIDIYVGEGRCRCSYNSISGQRLKVYIVK